jgi:hypothetical protein
VTTHFTASLRFGGAPSSGPEAASPPTEGVGAVGADAIYQVYFHGPAFQVLASAWREGDRAVGRLASPLPPLCGSSGARLAGVPRLVELCFQTAGVWEIGTSGRMGLPQRIERVWIASDASEGPGERHAIVSPRDDGSFDAHVVDEAGRVLVRLEGYATARLPEPVPSALGAPLREAMAG